MGICYICLVTGFYLTFAFQNNDVERGREALKLPIKPGPDWVIVARGWREPGGQPCAEPPLPAPLS